MRENKVEGEHQRVEFMSVQRYSPWHDIDSTTESEHYVNAVIEIPVGTKRKFEVATMEDFNSIKPDMKDGKIRLLQYSGDGDPNNRFRFNGMPHAYGMIPRTFEDPQHKEICTVAVIGQPNQTKQVELGGDEDPLDIYILSERKLQMGVVKCKVLGVIQFVDGGEMDYKVIALDADFPGCKDIKELSDLKKTTSFATAEAEILNWLKYYKTVDNDGNKIKNWEKKLGKYIVDRQTDSYEARKVIKECA